MTQRKRPKDLRAGLADIYSAKDNTGDADPKARASSLPATDVKPNDTSKLGRVGGAPAVLVEQQKQGLIQENASLRAAIDEIRLEGQVTVDISPNRVLDRYPPDRIPHAFADEAFENLVKSIQENGQDQPILVRPHPTKPDHFEIAYGRRRREACKRIGRKIKALVRPLSDEELLRLMLRENEEREDLSLYERARFMRALSNAESLSVRALGKRLNISPGYVSRLLRLPELPESLLSLIGDPRPLSMRTLEALATMLEHDAEANIDRVLEGWGSLRPASSPDGRARQILKLAKGELPAEPGLSRPIHGPGGRIIGQLKHERSGKRRIELASDLGESEIETILSAVEAALHPKD